LEDRPDHHEDILNFFYIWDRFFTETLLISQFYVYNFYIYIQLITCIRVQSRSTDVQHITSLHQIAYVQRIRCIKNSPSNI
jgi:hypothetical protein